MNWGEIKTLCYSNLGRSTSDVGSLLPLWAAMFQLSAQRDRNYFFLKATAERTIDENSQIYELPPGYNDGLSMYVKHTNPAGYSELWPISDVDVLRLYSPGTGTSDKQEPAHYQLGANTVTFWPFPDQEYTIRSQYWQDIAPPVAASGDAFTNYWIDHYPDLYIANITTLGFRRLQLHKDAAEWKKEADRILLDLRADHVNRELRGELILTPRMDVYGVTAERFRSWRLR